MPGVRRHHEEFRRDTKIESSSERSFGLVFAAFFAIAGCLPLRHGAPVRVWALAVSGAFFFAALVAPSILGPLNRLWFRLGLLLSRVVNPVVMALLFYLVITPFGLVFRILGKDPLRLRWDQKAASYWVPREPPGPAPEGMPNQF